MKDRVSNDIGVKEPLEDWASIDWKLVKKRVRNLRQRIYRATQNGQWNKVRSLMKLMLRSYSNLLLAIRRVTQENQGKKTAGIDGQTALTLAERVKLIEEMKGHNLWKVRPTKRVYIPKANGKQRPLGIPTIKDRIAQAIVKNAIEPSWEAQFEAQSYGFRPGRSCHDAIEQCHNRLRMGKNCPNDKWVLDADIKGAFDNISHEYILKAIHKLRTISIERHTKVKGNASPDDPTLVQYWQSRKTKYGKSYWVKGSKLYKVALQQSWKCPVCGEHLFNGEALHTHHKIAVKDGGQDTVENLIHIHQNCHRQIHMRKRSREQKA